MTQLNLLIDDHVRIWRTPLPLPNVLRAVNGYLMIANSDVVIIDPGFRDAETMEVWAQHLHLLGLSWDAVTDVVVTHYHPDHCGMAGWIQRNSNARLWMSKKTACIMQNMWGNSQTEQPQIWSEISMPNELIALFREHGLPMEWVERFDQHFESFQQRVTPLPAFERCFWLEDQQRIELAGLRWQVIFAEGHASGQCMLWQEKNRWLFCADHVLPDISPNITVLANDDPNPLETFLRDLKNVQQLPVFIAFPGHRGVLKRWSDRIDELLQHHDARLDQIERLVCEEGPVQAWSLLSKVYAKIQTDQQMRFALAEMIAHLWWLREKGRIAEVKRSQRDQPTIWYMKP